MNYVLTELSEGHTNNATFPTEVEARRELARRKALPPTTYPVDYRIWASLNGNRWGPILVKDTRPAISAEALAAKDAHDELARDMNFHHYEGEEYMAKLDELERLYEEYKRLTRP